MDPRIHLTILAVKAHQELSVEELARSVDLSASRFHHLFKEGTNVTPMHYMRMLRMDQARQLLETSSLSVKQVMNAVGVKDRSHFDREFKKAYGVTPKQCRRAALYNSYLEQQELTAASAIKQQQPP